MQSLYWVITHACHRRCAHCYDDRFRPYVRDALSEVVGVGKAAWESVLSNLPDDMRWTDAKGESHRTTLILAGGEPLLDGVREELFYPVLGGIALRWGDRSPKIAIQTTGDLLTPAILDECLERGVESIAIASIDDYHVGMTGDRKFAFMKRIREVMASRGVAEISLGGQLDPRVETPPGPAPRPDQPTFLFFGAQKELWIGELWPRGRAWKNGLSEAGYKDNFCARWSGAKNFLELGRAGSEAALSPSGDLYPCCIKTKAPLGNLAEERLEDILGDLHDLPAIQALNRGDPEGMGEHAGWSRKRFQLESRAEDGSGRVRANPCLGCDAFFADRLGEELRGRRLARLQRRSAVAADT